jgi:SAM-dependent methyltransferase
MNTTIIVATYPGDPYYDHISYLLKELKYPVIYSDIKDKKSFSQNNNIGAKKAKTKYLLFLNSDTIPKNDFVEKMEKVLDNNSRFGVVGAKLVYLKDFKQQVKFRGRNNVISGVKGTVQHAGISYNDALLPFEVGKGLLPDNIQISKSYITGSVTGACMMVRREEFLNIGGFDEGFVNGWEDTDLCLRYLEENKQLSYYNADVEVGHYFAGAGYNGRFDNEDKNFNYWIDKWHNSERIFKLFMLPLKKLYIGCGGDSRDGYIGIDKYPGENVNVVFDLNNLSYRRNNLPYPDNNIDSIYCDRVLNEVDHIIDIMNEFHRILKPNGLLELVVPHAHSWTAIANPFTKHYFIPETFTEYFASDSINNNMKNNLQLGEVYPWHIEKIDVSSVPPSINPFDLDRSIQYL